MTQQTKLLTALKRRWLNAGDIQRILGSTCPHKRLADLKGAGITIKKRESKNASFRFEYRAA